MIPSMIVMIVTIVMMIMIIIIIIVITQSIFKLELPYFAWKLN